VRVALIALALLAGAASAQDYRQDPRYCGPPERWADGTIKRSSAVTRQFQLIHPCPTTGLRYGHCPLWAKNHDIPLACGGCDSVHNLSWMRNDVKTLHDSYERRIYGQGIPGTERGCPMPRADRG